MIDIALDYISYSIRYGLLSWVTLALTVVALFKSRKLRKRFNKYLPPLFRDDQDTEVGKYIQNQKRIESKIDALLHKGGIVWNGSIETLSNTDQPNYKRSFSLLQMVKNRKNRRMKNMNFLKSNLSKKLTMVIVTTLLIALNEKLSLGMSQETIFTLAGMVAAYVAGQSVVDAKKEVNKGGEQLH